MAGSESRRPRVDYLGMGGTIASVRSGTAPGAQPRLSAEEIARSVPGIEDVADLRASQFAQVPSASLAFEHVLSLHAEIAARVADGASGVVVTQGTDSIEETAFALDLLWQGEAPIVISGAMRNASLPGADGPANLLAAVQVAASEAARGLGVVGVFNEEIHAARFLSKTHTSNMGAFRSLGAGPLGWVSEGRVYVALRPARRSTLVVPHDAEVPPVALVRFALGEDGRILPELARLGYAGAVLEGFGGGHVPAEAVPLIADLAGKMPVVLASRTGSGEVLSDTYGFPGGEIELLALGLIRAGALDGLKARIVLSLCLARGDSRQQIADAFAAVGETSGAVWAG